MESSINQSKVDYDFDDCIDIVTQNYELMLTYFTKEMGFDYDHWYCTATGYREGYYEVLEAEGDDIKALVKSIE